MAKHASQTRDARTTYRTSARCLGTEVNICAKRRRWTVEQKRQIVAEGLERGMSAAMVARKHGIRTGQFYAWRQQLVLRGALDAGADSVPNVAGIDATASAPDPEAAIAAPPEPNTPTTAVTTVPPVQPDDRIDVPSLDGVATGQLREDFGAEHALTTDRTSVPNGPRAARADCGQADRSGETAPGSARLRALRRFRHGDRVDRTGRSPVPGEQLLKLVALGSAGDQTFEHVGQVASGSTPFNFAVPIMVKAIAQCSAAPSEPLNKAFFRATATPFMPRSTTLVSISSRPSSRNSTRPDQCRST
jgi:transposase-like protein